MVTGSGRKIGIVINGDYQEDDINTYFAHEKINPPNLVRRPVLGGSLFNKDSSVETELDIEQAGGMAPGATIVHYNIPDLSDEAVFAGYITLVEDNQVDIVNLSFGACEKLYTAEYSNGVDDTGILRAEDDLFRQGNAQGITFVASSGDNGGLDCPTPDYFTTPPTNPPSVVGHFIPAVEFPASSPHVTAVGGTNLVTTFAPPLLKSEYIRENAYYDPLIPYDPYGTGNLAEGGVWGSGGGESIVFDKPSFQNLVNTGTQKRAVPDLSLHMGGCPDIAVLPCSNDRSSDVERFNGEYIPEIGTSASSPDFAGLLALKEEALGCVRLGNANYIIYALSAQNDVSKVYRQDIPGDNGVFQTSVGYNLVVGNGTVIGNNFVFDGPTHFPSAGDPQTPSNP